VVASGARVRPSQHNPAAAEEGKTIGRRRGSGAYGEM